MSFKVSSKNPRATIHFIISTNTIFKSLFFIFKIPFIEDQSQFRTAVFIDVGNVFSTNCSAYQTECFAPDFDELRGSYGLGGSAITPFGPISVYVAIPFNNGPLDRVKRYEFTVGYKF